MTMTAFGQSSLAQRGLVLATAKATAHALEPCARPDCPAPGICTGNGYQLVAGPSGPKLQLSIPHHKTKVAGPVLVASPREQQMVLLYERRGRPALLLPGREETAMYLTADGAAFTDEGISRWWKDLHRWGLPPAAAAEPRCRAVPPRCWWQPSALLPTHPQAHPGHLALRVAAQGAGRVHLQAAGQP
jgi:hypothetical protein